MSTQLIGFSMGGICRRFLVTPPSMIWPANLVYCALYNTLHSTHYAGIGERGGMSRERFFMYTFVGATVYYLLPGSVGLLSKSAHHHLIGYLATSSRPSLSSTGSAGLRQTIRPSTRSSVTPLVSACPS